MRSRFDEQLFQLNRELIAMGSMCENAIASAVKAVCTGDILLAKQVLDRGVGIDDKEREIEGLCMKLLLHQQPVAGDLRLISAALKMITDMERIGDQAEDIAEIVTFLNGRTDKNTELIQEMGEAAMDMVAKSIDSFIKKETSLAITVINQDDIVDRYFDHVKAMIIGMIAKYPEEGEFALDLLMISKYLERIGDHAVNIAQWVIYSVTGVHKEA